MSKKKKVSYLQQQRYKKEQAVSNERAFLKEARRVHQENKDRVSHRVKADPKYTVLYDPKRFDFNDIDKRTEKKKRYTISLEDQGLL